MPWLILPGSAPWPRRPFRAASPPALPTSSLPASAMPFAISSLLPWSLFLSAAMAQPPSALRKPSMIPRAQQNASRLSAIRGLGHVRPDVPDDRASHAWFSSTFAYAGAALGSRQDHRARPQAGRSGPCASASSGSRETCSSRGSRPQATEAGDLDRLDSFHPNRGIARVANLHPHAFGRKKQGICHKLSYRSFAIILKV